VAGVLTHQFYFDRPL